ncbi:MAG: ABC transporter permease [Spirochaetes bacterium]|nr:ABC transporter permease [Spirochaetota bacterium]
MKYIFTIAFKNIIAQKRRTALTFAMLSFGISFFIVIYGMLEGFDISSFDNLIKSQTGHLKIRSTDFDEDSPYDLDNTFKFSSDISSVLESESFIKGYAERINFVAEIDNTIDSSPVIVVGIDSQKDKSVFDLQDKMRGELKPESCVLGSVLAEDLNLAIGNLCYITFRDSSGMITSIELEITGILTTADLVINSTTVLININDAQSLLNTDKISEIAILTDNPDKVYGYRDILSSKIPDRQIITWQALAEDFANITRTKRKGSSVILIFILIISMVGIINTMIMSVYEKKTEIGTMKALGMTDRQVEYMFLFEGLIIGISGCLIGLFLGSVFNFYFAYVGVDWGALMGAEDLASMGFSVTGKIKSTWPLSAYLVSFILSMAASAAASFYPARKVLKMQPVECLRTIQ